MIAGLTYRFVRELSPRIAFKCLYLYAWKGAKAVSAYKKRLKHGELYPPFLFIALTNTCNLRCHGCWVEKEGTPRNLDVKDLNNILDQGKKQNAYYYTLLGGEPMMYKGIWDLFKNYSDCYFQVITNGMYFTERNADRIAEAGNVTPLISIDGYASQNDLRRGEGVYDSAMEGLRRLKQRGVFFGVATTITGKNLEDVLSDDYVQDFIHKGAMYLWYYVYRPVGDEPHTEYCVTRDQLIDIRRRLLALRRKHPILIIDTYWTAEGEAFCPAAVGLGYHIGPEGSIEICPPLSFATETVRDNDGDLYTTFNNSDYLRGFQTFVKERTKGCVILEHPKELTQYIQGCGAKDYSTRDAFAELGAGEPRHSHDLPGEEIPEDHWLYRFMKKRVFFGMGAAG
jgi:MoaA/NifB/PqqE/SkfB family radical SAM enzyme